MHLSSKIYNSIYDLPSSFRSLIDERSKKGSFFESIAWFEIFTDNVSIDKQKVFWLAIEDDNNTPILIIPLWYQDILQRRNIRCLRSLSNYYTTQFSPIYEHKKSALLDEAFIAASREILSISDTWDVLDLLPMDPKSIHFACLQRSLKNSSFSITPYYTFKNWHEDLHGRTFSEYYSDRPSILRNTFSRKLKRINNRHTLDITIHTSGDNLEDAIQHYLHVYHESWKKSEPYPDFIPNLIRRFSQEGWIRLGLAKIDGKVAAAQICIVHNSTCYIYKLAYDPSFRKLSVGTILNMHMLESAIDEDKVDTLDFLTGDDSYKQLWMSSFREMWGIQVANKKTWRGMMISMQNSLGSFWQRNVSRLNRHNH